MKLPNRYSNRRGTCRVAVFGLLSVVLLGAAVVVCAQGPGIVSGGAVDAARPIKNLRIPIESYEDGRPKVHLVAESATVPLDGDIVGEGVRVEFYSYADGVTNTDAVIEAKDCTYNKKTGEAKSGGAVLFERKEISVAGTGLEWNSGEQVIKILANVKVTLARDLQIKR